MLWLLIASPPAHLPPSPASWNLPMGVSHRRWMGTRGAAECQPGLSPWAVLPASEQFCCHWVPAFLLCWELGEGAQPGTGILRHKAKLGAVGELDELLPYNEHLAMFLVHFAGNTGGVLGFPARLLLPCRIIWS